MDTPTYELSLFSGAGGGLLATQHLLGFRTLCYVEQAEYPVRVLRARIQDGLLDDAPIWDDVRTFRRDNPECGEFIDQLAQVDNLVVTAVFPCRPFTRGHCTATSLWPEVTRITREIEPACVFAENVSRKAIDVACDDLEAMGYETRAISLSAQDLGADHVRRRYWLLAHSDVYSEPRCAGHAETPELSQFRGSVWAAGPTELRVVDELASRMDRLATIGEGQVPIVAATVWRILSECR